MEKLPSAAPGRRWRCTPGVSGAGLVHGYMRAVPWSAAARQAQDSCLDWLADRLATEVPATA